MPPFVLPEILAGTASPVASIPGPSKRRRLALLETLLARAWGRGWSERPSLEPEALVRTAERRSGLAADDDVSGWRARLDILCSDLEGEARLSGLGRTIAHGQLVALLANRFRAAALWRRYPEIRDQPLPKPVVVLGQMRSGTTRMQRLLACDPRLTHTRFYESWNPVPLAAGRPRLDDRKARGWAGLAAARLLNPGFDGFHPTRWNAPDEEIGLQSLAIFGAAFEAQWRVPNYRNRIETEDARPAYRELRRMMQTLAWLRRDDGRRPPILKVPQFTQDLPALLAVFPDARLVCVVRDARAVVASAAAMVANQMAVQSDNADRAWIAREWIRKTALRERRMARARAAADVPQVEIDYAAMEGDWAGQVARVYRMLGTGLPQAVRAGMAGYLRAAEARPRRPAYAAAGAPRLADA